MAAVIPFTFTFAWQNVDETFRRQLFAEFAANGAKHLTLTDGLLKMIGENPALYRKLPAEAAEAGIAFTDAHAPFTGETDLGMPVRAWRPQMLARQKYHLQVVSDFGIRTCTMHPSTTFYPEYSVAEHLEAVRRSLDALLPLAESLDVTICLENIYKPCCTAADLLTLLSEYPSDHLGVCYDSGHAHIVEHGRSTPDWVARRNWTEKGLGDVPEEHDILGRLLPHIVNCHLHDNDAMWDVHLLPGKGTIDWQPLLARLRTAPRLRCMQSEVASTCGYPVGLMVNTFRELLSARIPGEAEIVF